MQMKTLTIVNDIAVLCLKAPIFPNDVSTTHNQLHALISDSKNRQFFGISHPNKNGEIIYKAAIEQKIENEAKFFNLESFTISKGNYAFIDLIDYYKNIPNVEITFKKLIALPNINPNGFCLEWYLTSRDLRCMVKLND